MFAQPAFDAALLFDRASGERILPPAALRELAWLPLTLDKVSKIYGPEGPHAVRAVEDVNMTIADGEIVGLLGSSGCGKTSTLRMIAGFESVSQGEIRLSERIINDLPPARRNVAMAFEGYSLYPPLRSARTSASRSCATASRASRSRRRCARSPSCSRSPTSSNAIRRPSPPASSSAPASPAR